jgi:acyl carrier protein
MVVGFEKIFGIRFSPENMQSLEFRTIGGLIGIIDNLRKEQPGE